MSSEQDIVRAREEVDRARERMAVTLIELRQRLAPKTLLNDAWHEVRDRGQDLAGEAVQIVRTKPVATSAIAAALIAFVAREPLWRALNSLLSNGRSRSKADKSKSDSDPAPATTGDVAHQHEEVA